MMRGMAFWRFDGGFPAYVPVAERRAKALLQAKQLEKKGRKLDPIRVAGTRIAASFWGKAWCKNLESYSDFASRLPRGRTYLRAGAVLDLRDRRRQRRCAGRRQLAVRGVGAHPAAGAQALEGRDLQLRRAGGLRHRAAFGARAGGGAARDGRSEGGTLSRAGEIEFDCSCPDFAGMCKHIAAVLYGVGARLDRSPELFFTLRKLDVNDLVASSVPVAAPSDLDAASLEGIFGIELDREEPAPRKRPRRRA